MTTHEEIMARYAILQNRPALHLDSSDSEDDGATLEDLKRKYDAKPTDLSDYDDDSEDKSDEEDEEVPASAIGAAVPGGASGTKLQIGLSRRLQDVYGASSDDEELPGETSSPVPSSNTTTDEQDATSSLPDIEHPTGAWKETLNRKWAPMTFEEVRMASAEFAVARDWTQFHRPRNLMAALTSEIGELTEGLGLWRDVGYGGEGLTASEKHHVGEEITDCLVYLLRLSDILDVDLPEAVEAKLQKNAAKYPADLVRGSSKKYTEYKQAARTSQ